MESIYTKTNGQANGKAKLDKIALTPAGRRALQEPDDQYEHHQRVVTFTSLVQDMQRFRTLNPHFEVELIVRTRPAGNKVQRRAAN